MAQDPRQVHFDFLLGRMPEPDREAFEARLFDNDAAFAELEASEHDLIDLYASGQLSRGDRERMESHYLATGDIAARQRRLAFARQLQVAANRVQQPWWKRLFVMPGPMPTFATAAVAVVVAIAGWYALRDASAPKPEPPVIAQQPPVVEDKKPQLIAKAVLLDLKPGLERAGGSPLPMLQLQTSAEVRLRLQLEIADWPRYEASLETPEGAVLWRGANLQAKGKLLEAVVPATLLKPGDYIVRVSGVQAGGVKESAADYSFQVRR